MWDPRNLNQMAYLKGHEGGVLCLEKYNQNSLVSASGDETLKVCFKIISSESK